MLKKILRYCSHLFIEVLERKIPFTLSRSPSVRYFNVFYCCVQSRPVIQLRKEHLFLGKSSLGEMMRCAFWWHVTSCESCQRVSQSTRTNLLDGLRRNAVWYGTVRCPGQINTSNMTSARRRFVLTAVVNPLFGIPRSSLR